MEVNDSLVLQRSLRQVSAPPELWDRIQDSKSVSPRENKRPLVWAMAAAVVVMAAGLSFIRRDNVAYTPLNNEHCQNPAQLRAWVRANTGLDLPLRADSSPSIQLIYARNTGGRVEIAYRAGNRDALLSVSRADAGSRNAPHNGGNGNVSSWVMDGQRLTLACADPAALQLACKLCHLD